MKKIVLFVVGLLFLITGVSAYSVIIQAPDSLPVGKPLIVTGTTTFGIGTPIDVVLYYQLTTATEIQRNVVYIQSDQTFQTVFDTTGLQTGTYKVEVPANTGGDSVTARVVQLIDRSDQISLTSPVTQNFKSSMYVAGTIKGDENSGVQLEVLGPEGVVVFGPKYINTNAAGDFSSDVPITEPGAYEISFTDVNGYIGARTITILGSESPSQSPPGSPVPRNTRLPSLLSTSTGTPTPSPASPLSSLIVIAAAGLGLFIAGRRR